MKKNIVIAVLSLTTLAALGWSIHERLHADRLRSEQARMKGSHSLLESNAISDLRRQLTDQQRSTEAMQARYEVVIGQLKSEIAEKRDGLDNHQDRSKAVEKLESESSESGNEKALAFTEQGMTSAPLNGPTGKRMMTDLAKMMKNPEMKKMVQSQQKYIMDISYGSLYDMLNLPPDQLASLKELLEKRQAEMMEVGFDMMDDSLTDEQREARQKSIMERQTQFNKEIETLLGDENYDVFKAYEETQAERMQVYMFNQTLGTDMQLNQTQQNDLIWAMHEERSTFNFTSGLQNQAAMMDPTSMSPESVSQFMQENRQLHAQYVERASKLLTPAQLEKFRSSLEQQQAMQEFGMKMMIGETNGNTMPGNTSP